MTRLKLKFSRFTIFSHSILEKIQNKNNNLHATSFFNLFSGVAAGVGADVGMGVGPSGVGTDGVMGPGGFGAGVGPDAMGPSGADPAGLAGSPEAVATGTACN